MIRSFYFLFTLLTLGFRSFAQIGMGGPAHPSAVLDLKSPTHNQGFLLTRLSTAQRKAIVNPAVGLLVFDLDKSTIFLYDGQFWVPLATTDITQLTPLSRTVADGQAGDELGISVAISGDYAVVGAPGCDVAGRANQGAVYVFIRSGTTWTQQAILTSSDGVVDDNFGGSVAIAGDYIVVGCPNANNTVINSDQGAAYVFVRLGSNWSQQAKLIATDANAGAKLGSSVAIWGDDILVGAPFADVSFGADRGAAYVFTRSGSNWSQQAKLTTTDGAADDQFGYSVAIGDNLALVGAPNHTSNRGAAYGFSRSGNTWSNPPRKLTANNGADGDKFGYAVALSGNYAIIGAPNDDVNANTDQGSAYVFLQSSGSWFGRAQVFASDGAAGENFGQAVSVSGDYYLIGAPGDDIGTNANQGSTYTFFRSNDSTYQQVRKTTDAPASSLRMGAGAGISNGALLMGAPGFENNRGKLLFSVID